MTFSIFAFNGELNGKFLLFRFFFSRVYMRKVYVKRRDRLVTKEKSINAAFFA